MFVGNYFKYFNFIWYINQPNMRNLSLKLRTLNTLTEFN